MNIKWYPAIFTALIILFAAIAFQYFRTADNILWGDSYDYLRQSAAPATSSDFLAGIRAPFVPLVYKLFSQDVDAIIHFQIGLFFAAWLIPLWVITRVIRSKIVQLLAVFLLLGLAVSTDVLIWQKIIMSESISNALLVLVTAAWLWILQVLPHRKSLFFQISAAFALLPLMAMWSFSRDTNAYIVLSAAGVVIIFAARKNLRPWRPFMGLMFIGLLVIFLAQNRSMNQSERWQYPLANVITYRILPDDDSRQYFAEHGLPVDAQAMQFSGQILAGEGGDWNAVFGRWMDEKNVRQIYLRYLLSRPVDSFFAPFENANRLLEPKVWDYTKTFEPPDDFYQTLDYLFYAPEGFWLIAVLLLMGSTMLFIAAQRQYDKRWIVPLFLLALVYPLAFLVWHSDAYDVDRHAIGVSLQLRLGLILLFVFSLDKLIELHQQQFSWRTVTPQKMSRTLAIVILPLLLLEIIFRLPATRTSLILPAAVEFFPEKNVLAAWNVSDVEYYAAVDHLQKWVEKDTLVVSPASVPEEETYLIDPAAWSFESHLSDGYKNRALQKWQETLQPGFLQDLNAEYIYTDALWYAYQNDFQRDMLTTNYELIKTWENDRQLYRVKSGNAEIVPNNTLIGMSEATFEQYQAHQSTLEIPPDAIIFNPVTGELDWFGSVDELGQYIEANQDNPDVLPGLFDLLTIWQKMRYESNLSLTSEQAEALAKWRATKHSPYLREAGINYLLVSDLWLQYLTEEEYGLLMYSGGYQLIYEWQSEIPGAYKLYRVTG